jgi:hypothetical protein
MASLSVARISARPATGTRAATVRVHARLDGGRGNVLDKPGADLSKRAGWDSLKDLGFSAWVPGTETGEPCARPRGCLRLGWGRHWKHD